jgi:hypothetical protein
MDAVTHVPSPTNEKVLDYAPGSAERAAIELALVELGAVKHDLPHTIGGERVTGTGPRIEVRQPHAHRKVLGVTRGATKAEAVALLKSNSAAAAAAIRALSDAELDAAAPASLYYGAPITCQFMLEDHAVRHSYHHAARIRGALGR